MAIYPLVAMTTTEIISRVVEAWTLSQAIKQLREELEASGMKVIEITVSKG